MPTGSIGSEESRWAVIALPEESGNPLINFDARVVITLPADLHSHIDELFAYPWSANLWLSIEKETEVSRIKVGKHCLVNLCCYALDDWGDGKVAPHAFMQADANQAVLLFNRGNSAG